jgi:hypothetical protein
MVLVLSLVVYMNVVVFLFFLCLFGQNRYLASLLRSVLLFVTSVVVSSDLYVSSGPSLLCSADLWDQDGCAALN